MTNTTAVPAGGVSPRVLTRGVLLIAIANAFFFLVHTGTFPTMPVYMSSRGAKETDIALMIGMVGFVSLFTRPFSGWAIDAFGRRTMMLGGIATVFSAVVAYGYAATVPALAMIRVVHGTAVGIVNTSAAAYVSDAAPAGRRAEVLGYAMAVQTTAGSLGPTLAFSLLTAGALAGWNVVAFWWPDLAANVLPGGNYGLLFLAMLVSAAIAFSLAFLAPGQPKPVSVRRPSIAAIIDRRMLVPLSLMILGTIPFVTVVSFLPFFGPERGLDNVGLYFTVQAFGSFVAGLTLGRPTDRFGRKPVAVICLLGAGMTMVALAGVSGAVTILAVGFLSGYSQAGARNAMTALTVDNVPPSERGSALSTLSMGTDLGVAIGGPLIGAVVAIGGFPACFVAAGAATFLGGVLGALLLK